jgi:hypothetical protein
MIYHLGNLLLASWQATLGHMGTTTLAALLLVAVYLVVPLKRFRSAGISALKNHFRDDALIAVAIIVGTWTTVFAYSLCETLYTDHQRFVDANLRLRQQLGDAKFTFGNLKVQVDALSAGCTISGELRRNCRSAEGQSASCGVFNLPTLE